MRVCILGGTGNISTSFVRPLLDKGHDVTLFNRGQSGSPPLGVRVITGDRSDRARFEETMRRERFDAVIDMICFNGEDAESDLRAFPEVGHLVHCSTVCTYGISYDWLPATEDHPLRPISDYGRGKVAADIVFIRAHYQGGYPVTIIKPSTTYGPRLGLKRQVAWMDATWIDRVRKGLPIVVCGDGNAIHQFLHVDDAALCFVNVLGKTRCIGQTYNMVDRGFTTWAQYHKTAMRIIGRDVEMVGVPFADLSAIGIPGFEICRDIYAHHVYYSAEKLFRDVPEFAPKISLEEGMRRVLDILDREGRIPDCGANQWEDRVIAAQRKVRTVAVEG